MKAGRQVKVKICGITDAAIALAAVEAGADALGFVFAASRRRVSPEAARDICKRLPQGVARVGVFVNTPPAEVAAVAAYCGLTAVQLSGDEPPGYRLPSPLPVIRAIRVGNGRGVPDLSRYKVDAFLFDTYREGSYGGTGRVFDWQILRNIYCPKPLILAGGLCAANVVEAVRAVKPYAVDVSGGVETGGRKDVHKIKQFINLAKGVVI